MSALSEADDHEAVAAFYAIPIHRRAKFRPLRALGRALVLLLNLAATLCAYLAFGISLVLMSGGESVNHTPAASFLFLVEFLFCIVSIAVSHHYFDTHRRPQAYAFAAVPILGFALLVLISL